MGLPNIGLRFAPLACVALFFLASCSTGSLEQSKDEKLGLLYFHSGNEELQSGNTTLALKNLQLANKHLPKNEDVLISLGIAYFRKGDVRAAEASLRKALEMNPENNFARNNLAAIYIETNRLDAAQKEVNIALKDLSFTDQYKVLFNLAVIQEKKGLPLRAEQSLQKSLVENPNFCPGWMKLSELQMRLSKRAEALDSLRSGSNGLCYSNPQTHYQLGLLLQQMNDLTGAQEKFDEVARRFPKSPWAKLATEKLSLLRERN